MNVLKVSAFDIYELIGREADALEWSCFVVKGLQGSRTRHHLVSLRKLCTYIVAMSSRVGGAGRRQGTGQGFDRLLWLGGRGRVFDLSCIPGGRNICLCL